MEPEEHALLIVDDDQALRSALAHWTRAQGYVGYTAQNAADARDFLKDRSVDAVLVDVHLPDADGLEFTRSLVRANPERPVIVITAYPDLIRAREAMDIGAFEFLAKPLDFGLLKVAVERAIAHRAALVQNRIRQTERLARANAALQKEVTDRRQQEEALALRTAELEEVNRRLQQKDRLLTAYQRIAPVALSTLDVEELLDRLVRNIVEAGILRALSVALVDEPGEELEVVRAIACLGAGDGLQLNTVEEMVGRRYRVAGDSLRAEVYRSGTTRVVDAADDPRLEEETQAPHSKNHVAYFLPIKRGGEVIAVLSTVSARGAREETIERLEMMEPLLDQVGVALHHARLYRSLETTSRALRERDKTLTAYHRIAKIALSSLDRDTILDSLAAEIVDAGIFRSLSVSLVDREGGRVHLLRALVKEAGTGRLIRTPNVEGLSYSLDSAMVTAEVARTGRVVVIDSCDDPRLDAQHEDPAGWTDKVAYFVPVMRGSEALAVLATGSARGERAEILERIDTIKPLLDLVAIALHNANLLERATRAVGALEEKDRLLGAYNRIAQVAISSLDVDEIVQRVGRQIIDMGIFRSLMIALVDEKSRTVEVVRTFVQSRTRGREVPPGSVLLSSSPVVGIRYGLDDPNVTAVAARTGELQVVDSFEDPRLDARVDHHPDRWQDKVAYFIPVKTDERVLGVLGTGSVRSDRDKMLAQIEEMEPVLTQMAIALEHARLYRATRDSEAALTKSNHDLEQEIVERKRAEEAVVRLERLSALGEMSAGVSHNLNNILTGILGPAELITRCTEDPDVLLEANVIRTSALRARDLVARLHHSVGGEGQSLQPVDITAAVREAIDAARPRWKDEPEAVGRSIEIVTELTAVPPVQGTPSGMHDLLLNLIFNAVDAMPEGGTIRISVARTEARVRLTLSDTGTGMSEDVRLRAFEPFFTTKADVGTGLGLSTVYGSVMRWGGEIDVESEPGSGTTFTANLKVWEGTEVLYAGTPEIVPTARPGRILIVEDEKIVCDIVSRILSPHHSVEVTNSGEDALDRMKTHPYDVALIDLGMPGMPGDQVADALRACDAAIATILMTGWSLPESDPRTGAFDFRIQKPFTDVGKLHDVVARAIAHHDALAHS